MVCLIRECMGRETLDVRRNRVRAQLPAIASLAGHRMPVKRGHETQERSWAPFFHLLSFLALVSFLEEPGHCLLQKQVVLGGGLDRA